MHVVRLVDPRRREEILRSVEELAQRIKDALGAEAVYLHGSFARGDVHEGSDIDLVVVADLPGRIFDRIYRVIDMTDLPVEPLVYTPEEFKEMVEKDNPFIIRVLTEGRRLI